MKVSFDAKTITHDHDEVETDRSSFLSIEFPKPKLAAPSLDLLPGAALQRLRVDVHGAKKGEQTPLGLLLVTNSYRTHNSTVAAIPGSEIILLLRDGFDHTQLRSERTPDIALPFPVTQDFAGPECALWDRQADCNISAATDSPSDETGEIHCRSLMRDLVRNQGVPSFC